MKLLVPVDTFRGLLMCAGNKDIRQQLNGICFESCGTAFASDGHCALIVRNLTNEYSDDNRQVIVPRDVCEDLIKSKFFKGCKSHIEVTPSAVGNMAYTPIDLRYPDVRRCIPEQSNLYATYDELRFDHNLVARVSDAWAKVTGSKQTCPLTPGLTHNCALMWHQQFPDVLGIIMKLSTKGFELEYAGFQC